jgi:hypothetical protein
LHRIKQSKTKVASVTTLAEFVPDLADWPRSWRYEDRDIAPGERIVACFTPFLQHLLNLGLSRIANAAGLSIPVPLGPPAAQEP